MSFSFTHTLKCLYVGKICKIVFRLEYQISRTTFSNETF